MKYISMIDLPAESIGVPIWISLSGIIFCCEYYKIYHNKKYFTKLTLVLFYLTPIDNNTSIDKNIVE